jgi:putative transposase
MKTTRCTDEQIAFALLQAETGTPVQEVIRKMGTSEQTFYRWKKLCGGLGPSEVRHRARSEDIDR